MSNFSCHTCKFEKTHNQGHQIQRSSLNSVVESTLLSTPYHTNCFSYEKEENGFELKSDCITKYTTIQTLKYCDVKCIKGNGNPLLYREDQIKDYFHHPICSSLLINKTSLDCISAKQMELMSVCEKRCPKSCFEIQYDFKLSRLQWRYRQFFALRLIHDTSLDTIIIHRTIMTFIDLISSFGGLIGIWLDLSLVLVFTFVDRLI